MATANNDVVGVLEDVGDGSPGGLAPSDAIACIMQFRSSS